ncbi:hypothetical protein CC80DRAFT_493103 [Byssothecium circinans]|uniref:Uncharacterized protein n=1 Tax=Byssothecium circinans TaxID=147558 RepID=A0A6A5TR30_9PLEO|nr:hypothetical protein CC80DRAFT_493103 [Byssothecium circinans]
MPKDLSNATYMDEAHRKVKSGTPYGLELEDRDIAKEAERQRRNDENDEEDKRYEAQMKEHREKEAAAAAAKAGKELKQPEGEPMEE